MEKELHVQCKGQAKQQVADVTRLSEQRTWTKFLILLLHHSLTSISELQIFYICTHTHSPNRTATLPEAATESSNKYGIGLLGYTLWSQLGLQACCSARMKPHLYSLALNQICFSLNSFKKTQYCGLANLLCLLFAYSLLK